MTHHRYTGIRCPQCHLYTLNYLSSYSAKCLACDFEVSWGPEETDEQPAPVALPSADGALANARKRIELEYAAVKFGYEPMTTLLSDAILLSGEVDHLTAANAALQAKVDAFEGVHSGIRDGVRESTATDYEDIPYHSPAPNGGATAADLAPVTVIEPAASYVVYDGTAYGPFWQFSLAMAYRQSQYPNGVVRQCTDREVKACKTFAPPVVDAVTPWEELKPQPEQPATPRKLSKGVKLTAAQVKALEFLAERGEKGARMSNKSMVGVYGAYVHRKPAEVLIKLGFARLSNDLVRSHKKAIITPAGVAALAARESEAGK